MKIILAKLINLLFIFFVCISMLSSCHATSDNTNELIRKVVQGDVATQYNLGLMYLEGKGIVQDSCGL
jgi:hypothetical protein